MYLFTISAKSITHALEFGQVNTLCLLLILANDDAKFADTHSKWALTPVWGISQRLPRRVGRTKAAEMMLTAKTYNAQEAEAM